MMNPEQPFFVDSGNLALDLLNTAQRAGADETDRLLSPEDLATWLRQTGLVGTGPRDEALRAPPTAKILLTEAHRLRDTMERVVHALHAHEPVPRHALYGLNRVLGAGHTTSSLVFDAGRASLVDAESGASLLAVLVPVAKAGADLVASADPGRLRRCASATCGRWFLDSSKGGRRKWCSMASCGNRAKAAAHRRRQRSG